VVEALIVTGGHPFPRDPFFAMLDALDGVGFTAVEHPAALERLAPESLEPFDCIVFYDLPGIEFRRPEPPRLIAPPERFRRDFESLLGSGKGLVFMHHASGGWPAWPAYAEAIGGTFLYQPGRFGGREWPDSGYVMDVDIRAVPVDPSHPVLAGLEDGFTLNDEPYLAPVMTDAVVPLLRSDWTYTADRFVPAGESVGGPSTPPGAWTHPDGSDLIAWTRVAGRCPLVYLQPGHGPRTFANPAYRRLLGNAVRWAASADARQWAAGAGVAGR